MAAVVALLGLPGSGGGAQVPDTDFADGFADSVKLAERLFRELKPVKKRFERQQRRIARRAYPPDETLTLIDATEEDLGRAFGRADRESELRPLEDWAHEELRRSRAILEAAPATAGSLPRPRAVAVVAALTLVATPVRGAETGNEQRAETALQRVSKALWDLLTLVKNDTLYTDLWVGTAPAPGAWFQLLRWGEDTVEDERQTDGVLSSRVNRGLYRARVAHGNRVFEAEVDLVRKSNRLCCLLDGQRCFHLARGDSCHGGV